MHCSDDSLGYEFPFVLRAVEREGLQCAWCPWYKFCRGCQLPCEDKMFPQNSAFLAIDWDPTALHLRYQSALERVSVIMETIVNIKRIMHEHEDGSFTSILLNVIGRFLVITFSDNREDYNYCHVFRPDILCIFITLQRSGIHWFFF